MNNVRHDQSLPLSPYGIHEVVIAYKYLAKGVLGRTRASY